jgi:hypothetical protein
VVIISWLGGFGGVGGATWICVSFLRRESRQLELQVRKRPTLSPNTPENKNRQTWTAHSGSLAKRVVVRRNTSQLVVPY